MPDSPRTEPSIQVREAYDKPRLHDYGNFADVTAFNSNGVRADTTLPAGSIATFS